MNFNHQSFTNKNSSSIPPNQLQMTNSSSKIFRTCKKPMKLINNPKNTPKFFDQNHIKTQLKDWVNKMNESKKQKASKSEKINVTGVSSNKLYQIINQIREDEKLVIRDLSAEYRTPKTSRKNLSSSIKINLQEVQRMKSTIQQSKVILSPKDFQINLNQRPATTFGYRPLQSRFQRHFNSKKNLRNSQHQRKRCLTERKQLFTIDSFEKYIQSPTTPLSTSKGESLNYKNKSKIKKVWETIGLHEWNNIN